MVGQLKLALVPHQRDPVGSEYRRPRTVPLQPVGGGAWRQIAPLLAYHRPIGLLVRLHHQAPANLTVQVDHREELLQLCAIPDAIGRVILYGPERLTG